MPKEPGDDRDMDEVQAVGETADGHQGARSKHGGDNPWLPQQQPNQDERHHQSDQREVHIVELRMVESASQKHEA